MSHAAQHQRLIVLQIWIVVGATALALAGCKSGDNPAGDAQLDRSGGDLVVGEKVIKPDQKVVKPDLPTAKKPAITLLLPDGGPADGGASGQIPVTIVGENFAAGMAVYIDGQPLGTAVNVASSVSASFNMPKNPYGPPYDKPQKVSVGLLSGSQFSNQLSFQYTITIPLTDKFKGSITTTASSGYRDFPSDDIKGKVLVDLAGTDAGAPQPVKAQVGIGPTGSDPTKDSTWRWFPANAAGKDGAYEVFSGVVTPWLAQSFDLAYRFSIDGGGRWIYADTDEADLKYDPAKAAKLTVAVAPTGFCMKNSDCILSAYEVVCKVDAANKANNKCVQCLADADCSSSTKAFGPFCQVAGTGPQCVCKADTDCAKNVNGAVCIPTGKYCGCTKDTNCTGTAKCTQDQNTGMTTCR